MDESIIPTNQQEYNEGDVVTNAQGAKLILHQGQWAPVNPTNARTADILNPNDPNMLSRWTGGQFTQPSDFVGLVNPSQAGLQAGRGILSAARNYLFGTPKEEAVGNFVQKQFGIPATAGERIATIQPGIRAAYQAAGGQANVPVNNVVRSVDQALQREAFASNPNKNAVDYLTNLRAKYQGGSDALYTDLIDESQALRREAGKYIGRDPATAHSFEMARQGLNQAMAEISPAAREAALAAQKGNAIPQLVKAARSKDPVMALGDLFEKKPSIAQAYGIHGPDAINAVLQKAHEMRLSQDPSKTAEFIKWILGIGIGGAAAGMGYRAAGGLMGGPQHGGGGY